MKIKNKKGFSLAEVLISLTVVSVMLAVAAPVITKHSVSGDETWQRTTSITRNGTAFNGNSVILGANNIPERRQVNDYFPSIDEQFFNTEDYNPLFDEYKATAHDNLFFDENERLVSKLSIVKPIQMYMLGIKTSFADSHISFYNLGADNTLPEYAGRIASDQFNLAFGIATLQSLRPLYYDTFKGGLYNNSISRNTDSIYNTAIGHYALAHNTTAKDNVGFGYGALFENDKAEKQTIGTGDDEKEIDAGSKNTAIGYKAMAETYSSKVDDSSRPYRNTVIGNHMSVLNNQGQFDFNNEYVDRVAGKDNIIIGNYDSFLRHGNILPRGNRTENKVYAPIDEWRSDEGFNKSNEHVKNYVQHIWGDNNILIGNNAGRGLPVYREGNQWSTSANITTRPDNTQETTKGFYTVVDDNGTKKPKFDNVLAIGNVKMFTSTEYSNLDDSERVDFADQRVELLQAKLDEERKLIINGDLTIRTADGTKTIFKVDASGIPVELSRSNTYLNAAYGPDRCEGAGICIAKFATPVLKANYATLSQVGTVAKYDIYIKGMTANRDSGSLLTYGTAPIPFLGLSLWYLDRFKNSQSILYSIKELFKQSKFYQALEKLGGGKLAEIIHSISTALGFSDERLKNIYGDSTIGLNEINALKVKNYTYKADKNNTPHVGVIAQDLQKIFPNSVNENPSGYLTINQEEMFYGLINSIQQLSDKNNAVLEKIAMSKQKIENTTKQNELIKQENKLLEKQNKEFAKRIAKLKKKK